MHPILAPLTELESFQALTAAIERNRTPALASGVIDSQKPHLAAGLLASLERPRSSAIITHSEVHAKEIIEDMRLFAGDRCVLYPSKDILFYSADVRSVTIARQRFEVISRLLSGDDVIVVMSAEALLDRLAPKEIFNENIFTLRAGDALTIDSLAERLVRIGYERTALVEGPGQFAVRGGVFDVCGATHDSPVRLEFWGDEIESIRLVDVISQRSVEKLDSVEIFPMNEVLGEKHIAEASILDYLPPGAVLFFDEPQRIKTHIKTLLFELGESIQNRISQGHAIPEQANVFSYAEALAKSAQFATVLFSTLAQTAEDFSVKTSLSFAVRSTGTFKQRIELLARDLEYWCDNGYRILFLAGAPGRGHRIADELRGRNIPAAYIDNPDGPLKRSFVTVSHGSLARGFEYQHISFVVITDQELLGERRRRKARRKKSTHIESFSDLTVGDYIVHDSHGIGIYRGIEQVLVEEGVLRDYLKLEYADGGILYIHTGQMDMVQKYIGGDDIKVNINKLGGGEWNKAKSRAKKVVEELASELVELYAKRRAAKGYVYSNDTVWQREFEEMTPFEETDDQLAAIEDVKNDMQSEVVMDRLICGDVGYGKTEIALRAAFKAAQDGKQTAFLVPTTILAQQHYNTFTQRLKDFPVSIAMTSRFRSAKENLDTAQKLGRGAIDIVIGTHKLLSKNIQFKDLGLVIVDEEHRFGVRHKEKLKRLRENVDVLTLTATPIPRTLHMSLTGIRDMSTLEEPPQERLTVQTYVMEYDAELVREAINRELARDGQVYYLHNRVFNIAETAARVRNLLPHASVAYAHGRMPEHELEDVMLDFIEGSIQVLVCTTIIESGLDIPNVNTIIIEDADRMGLAQLYQLRGRVGRSSRQAYAYLMYRKDKMLHETAEKRLQAIRDFTEFGAGFKIAMRDLEIRGAGNILGGQQHGHISAIGYEMYCRLLTEAVAEMRGEPVAKPFETSIDISVSAFIPVYYISNEEQKLEAYKKISLITSESDYNDVKDEIEDRYGKLPDQAQSLLDIALLKAYAYRLGMTSVTQKDNRIVMLFKPDADIDPAKILNLVNENKDLFMFSVRAAPTLTYKITDAEAAVAHLRELLAGVV
ncbi:MAG: transcription-repair coupling factor [Defluviitaleaceae bacterium]|nr:transcription-repair coupling factor [Defluviitaleaceae bacterium]